MMVYQACPATVGALRLVGDDLLPGLSSTMCERTELVEPTSTLQDEGAT